MQASRTIRAAENAAFCPHQSSPPLLGFWPPLPASARPHSHPFISPGPTHRRSNILKIMRNNIKVKMVTKEALALMAKAIDLFIRHLVWDAVAKAPRKRGTMQVSREPWAVGRGP